MKIKHAQCTHDYARGPLLIILSLPIRIARCRSFVHGEKWKVILPLVDHKFQASVVNLENKMHNAPMIMREVPIHYIMLWYGCNNSYSYRTGLLHNCKNIEQDKMFFILNVVFNYTRIDASLHMPCTQNSNIVSTLPYDWHTTCFPWIVPWRYPCDNE